MAGIATDETTVTNPIKNPTWKFRTTIFPCVDKPMLPSAAIPMMEYGAQNNGCA